MKNASGKTSKPDNAPESFGEGIATGGPAPQPEPPAPRRIGPRAIERRLFQLLEPLIKAQGGFIAMFEEIGEPELCGVTITLRGDQTFDLTVREVRP